MTGFVAKRVRFRNGEHHSILSRPGSLPVHEATIYLANYGKRGRSRVRYMGDYLEFLAMYVGATLPRIPRKELAIETAQALKVFRAQMPRTSKRAKLGAREGLSKGSGPAT